MIALVGNENGLEQTNLSTSPRPTVRGAGLHPGTRDRTTRRRTSFAGTTQSDLRCLCYGLSTRLSNLSIHER